MEVQVTGLLKTLQSPRHGQNFISIAYEPSTTEAKAPTLREKRAEGWATPASYRLLGKLENLGNVVEVFGTERDALLQLEISPVKLQLQDAATSFDDKRAILSLDTAIRKEIGRITSILIERAKRGGTESVRVSPVRLLDADIQILLAKKWREQKGCCLLCNGALVVGGSNKLLQASADRINSSLPSYDTKNVHITHLGCNLAKSDVSMAEFAEWLVVVKKGEAAKGTTVS